MTSIPFLRRYPWLYAFSMDVSRIYGDRVPARARFQRGERGSRKQLTLETLRKRVATVLLPFKSNIPHIDIFGGHGSLTETTDWLPPPITQAAPVAGFGAGFPTNGRHTREVEHKDSQSCSSRIPGLLTSLASTVTSLA